MPPATMTVGKCILFISFIVVVVLVSPSTDRTTFSSSINANRKRAAYTLLPYMGAAYTLLP